MARTHKPEEIIGKLREAEIVLAQGGTVAGACRRIGVTEQSYYRWRKEYGGLKMDRKRCRAGIVVLTRTIPDFCGHERRQHF